MADLQRKKAILQPEVDVCIQVAILMVTSERAVGVGDRVPNRGKFNSSTNFILGFPQGFSVWSTMFRSTVVSNIWEHSWQSFALASLHS